MNYEDHKLNKGETVSRNGITLSSRTIRVPLKSIQSFSIPPIHREEDELYDWVFKVPEEALSKINSFLGGEDMVTKLDGKLSDHYVDGAMSDVCCLGKSNGLYTFEVNLFGEMSIKEARNRINDYLFEVITDSYLLNEADELGITNL
jgi:hypothetical protein